ncbi:flagellar protein FliS [Bosea sp. BE125]|uniref:flagellar export chaperone FliS n=1 Tax=Bosea sp. BE125 TaxID=2817909 RepID=UPI00286395B5|nr:flagellar protein FliS [Bosea sp. BE125]MDR6873678.1 flagellar protein FliS [Bosea sp. BE125]
MNQNASRAIATYRMVAAQVHPLVAVVKLYDEAIRQLHLAVRAIEARKHEESYICISKSSTILRGLYHNLRFDKGEDISQQLMKAYTYNIVAIHTAYGKPDAPVRYMKIIKHLGELRDSWAIVAGMSPKREEAPAPRHPQAAIRPVRVG